jgi:hypothetical protein
VLTKALSGGAARAIVGIDLYSGDQTYGTDPCYTGRLVPKYASVTTTHATDDPLLRINVADAVALCIKQTCAFKINCARSTYYYLSRILGSVRVLILATRENVCLEDGIRSGLQERGRTSGGCHADRRRTRTRTRIIPLFYERATSAN